MTCFETEASSSMCETRTWLKSRLHLVQMRVHSTPSISALDHQRANKNRSPTRHASKGLRRIGQWSHSHPDGFLQTTTQKSPDLRYVKCSHKNMFHSTVDDYNFLCKQRVWWSDDDVNCERRYWKVEVVLAVNEQTKRFKCTWESIPTFAMNGSNALSSWANRKGWGVAQAFFDP